MKKRHSFFLSFCHSGLLRNWWSEETLEKYKANAQCVIDQYGNFKEDQVT